MDRVFVLEKLRESYRNKDLKMMKVQLSMGSWFLTDEDKAKVKKAIEELENYSSEIREALRLLGGKVVDN